MSGTLARARAAYNTRLRVRQDAALPDSPKDEEHAMGEVSAGSRVWVKDGEQKQFGTIESIAVIQGFFRTTGSMVIRMDDGPRVLATTMAARGTTWDVVSENGKQSRRLWPGVQ